MACVCDYAHPQRTLLLDPPLPRHAAPCPSPTRRSKTIHLLTREDYERGCQHACTGVRCGRKHGCGGVTRYKQACLHPTCGVERTPAPAGDRGECGGDGAGRCRVREAAGRAGGTAAHRGRQRILGMQCTCDQKSKGERERDGKHHWSRQIYGPCSRPMPARSPPRVCEGAKSAGEMRTTRI